MRRNFLLQKQSFICRLLHKLPRKLVRIEHARVGNDIHSYVRVWL